MQHVEHGAWAGHPLTLTLNVTLSSNSSGIKRNDWDRMLGQSRESVYVFPVKSRPPIKRLIAEVESSWFVKTG